MSCIIYVLSLAMQNVTGERKQLYASEEMLLQSLVNITSEMSIYLTDALIF